MTALSPAENYCRTLADRLQEQYSTYIKELQIIEKQIEGSTAELLENFINIEQHRFHKISAAEKALNTHLQGCSPRFRSSLSESLQSRRTCAAEQSKMVKSKLKGEMGRIGAELSSLRRPGRAKNYKQESVPVLIDIET